mgnify:CR=1 FL=1
MKKVKYITLEEAIKDMNEEELESFKKERYEKFLKPLMRMNQKNIEKLSDISDDDSN